MSALVLIMNGTASQGGGGGGSGGMTASITAGSAAIRAVGTFDFGNNTCVVSGGTGPYTYVWSFTLTFAGDTSTWSSQGSTTATTDIKVTNAVDMTRANYICTVHDSAGHSAISNTASYLFQLSGGGLGLF